MTDDTKPKNPIDRLAQALLDIEEDPEASALALKEAREAFIEIRSLVSPELLDALDGWRTTNVLSRAAASSGILLEAVNFEKHTRQLLDFYESPAGKMRARVLSQRRMVESAAWMVQILHQLTAGANALAEDLAVQVHSAPHDVRLDAEQNTRVYKTTVQASIGDPKVEGSLTWQVAVVDPKTNEEGDR